MKDAIAEIITEYGLDKIRYGLIVFGETGSIKIPFGDHTNVDGLLQTLKVVPKPSSGAALDEMLKEAEKLFSASAGRPHAKKVLVVITDLASGKSPPQVSEAAKPLQDKAIKVVAVAIGREADPNELEIITSKQNIVEKPKNVLPNDLKKVIMVKVFKGNFLFFLYCMAPYMNNETYR